MNNMMLLTADQEEVKFTWRIPRSTAIELRHLAVDDGISVNTLVVQVLKDYLHKRKSKK